jgi:hypothetical protein
MIQAVMNTVTRIGNSEKTPAMGMLAIRFNVLLFGEESIYLKRMI